MEDAARAATRAPATCGRCSRRPTTRSSISKPGDEVALSFDARALGEPKPGLARTFLLHGDGFSKEMDINSASPDVVQPLPFHGMKSYPYPEADVPARVRAAWQKDESWNTRLVLRPIAPIELYARRGDEAGR